MSCSLRDWRWRLHVAALTVAGASACQELPAAHDAAVSAGDSAIMLVDAAAQPGSGDSDGSTTDAGVASASEASTAGPDAESDVGAPAIDASLADVSVPDASVASDDGVPVDASAATDGASNVITTTTQGTRCLGQTASNLDPDLCPAQACFSDQNQISAHVNDGALRCTYGAGCPYPTAEEFAEAELDESRVRTYEYRGPELVVFLAFRTTLLKSFTLEGMRAQLRYAAAGAMLTVDGRRELISGGAEANEVELLSYDAGKLRARIHASVHNYNQRIETIPHLCPGAHTLPKICEHSLCWWGTEKLTGGSGLPPRISLDVTIPIQPYDP